MTPPPPCLLGWLKEAKDNAGREGITPPAALRQELIRRRNAAIEDWPDGIEETVFLSHVIWWLAALEEVVQ